MSNPVFAMLMMLFPALMLLIIILIVPAPNEINEKRALRLAHEIEHAQLRQIIKSMPAHYHLKEETQ